MPAPYLIIPIETKVRELHAKSLLAARAAHAGMSVVLGDQRVIAESLHQLPRGIYVDKSISRTKTAHYQRLRKMGFSIVAWCEEGLAYRAKIQYQFERVYAPSLALLDAFFAWGDVNKEDVLEVAPEAIDKIHAHGNPRVDILRAELRDIFRSEADALSSRFGPYVLVNCNFSKFNVFEGRPSFIEVLRERGVLRTQQEEDHYKGFIAHTGMVFEAFVAMVPKIAAAMPNHQIILRPHPSENRERWKHELRDISNVHVIAEGSVIPWIMGATAVIHNNCTTGVESAILDRPTISYIPVLDEQFNSLTHVANGVSTIARTTDEVLAAAISARSETNTTQREALARHVANTSGPFATDEIVRTIVGLDFLPNAGKWESALARLRSATRKAAVRFKRKLRRDRTIDAYMDQKFPGLTLAELEQVFETIDRVSPQTIRLRIDAHPRLPHCFVIRAA